MPRHPNNNNYQQRSTQNGSQRNGQTCHQCGKHGHIERYCKKCTKCNNFGHLAASCQNGNRSENSGNGGDKHCDHHPNSKNHTTAECKKSKKDGSNNSQDRDGNIRMEGFAYADPSSHMSFATKYYLGRNSVAHYEAHCPDALE